MSRLPFLSFAAGLAVASTAFAQTLGGPLSGVAHRLVVTPSGTHLSESQGAGTPAQGGYSNTSAGTRWTHTDAGQAWIATTTSIGDRGTQVFAETDLNNERAVLLSAFDSQPPTPVWEDLSPLASEFRAVVSADATDTHCAIHQIVLNNNIQTRQAVLNKYGSHSSTPDWSYTFAPVINAGSNVGISRDGTKIVAAIYNDTLGQVEIATFGPSSNVPTSYTIYPVGVGNYMRGWDYSADGSTLYFSAGTTAYIFDIPTLTVVFFVNIGASFDSHSISGDGSVFAFGNFGIMRVFERSGGTYTNTFNRPVAGSCYCANIDISDDSSTIAYGFTFYDFYLKTQVEALDVPTKLVTMTHIGTGSGSFQNIISDVSISANGQHFAVGRWGDGGGLVNEVDVYDRNSNTPLVSSNLPGSVWSVDISADGQRVVAGSKAVHANTFGNGGRIDLLDVGNEDLDLRTVPHFGATLTFDLYGLANKPAAIGKALAEQTPPTVFPNIGTLYIQRSTLLFFPLGNTGPAGLCTGTFTLPNNPNTIGTSYYFQGLTAGPRKLTNDWIKVTILP
jgi:hypothetical protein